MKRFIRGQSGNNLVEFGLAAFVFFATIFGILEFGIGLWRYSIVANLSKEGARRAAVCGKNTGLTSTECDIQTYLRGRSYGLGTTVTATVTPSTLSAMVPGDVVTVTVTHNFRPGTNFLPRATIPLRSTAKMIVAR
jgi:Flp pilus assembly protein TadG